MLATLDITKTEELQLLKDLDRKYKPSNFIINVMREDKGVIAFLNSHCPADPIVAIDLTDNAKVYVNGLDTYPKSWLDKIQLDTNIDFESDWLRVFLRFVGSTFIYQGRGKKFKYNLEGIIAYPTRVLFLERMAKLPYSIGNSSLSPLWGQYTPEKTLHKSFGLTKQQFSMGVKRDLDNLTNIIDLLRVYPTKEYPNIWNFLYTLSNKNYDITELDVNYGKGTFIDITEEFLAYYSIPHLVDYLLDSLPLQGIDLREGLHYLVDYITMCNDMHLLNIDKYPRYLKTQHDIVSLNYKYKLDKAQQELFNQQYNSRQFSYAKDGYYVTPPTSPLEVTREGSSLNHCVASYIKRVIQGECLILFMRQQDDVPLVTLEIKGNSLVNAKGQSNRIPNDIEKDFLKNYCKDTQLIPDFLRYW